MELEKSNVIKLEKYYNIKPRISNIKPVKNNNSKPKI